MTAKAEPNKGVFVLGTALVIAILLATAGFKMYVKKKHPAQSGADETYGKGTSPNVFAHMTFEKGTYKRTLNGMVVRVDEEPSVPTKTDVEVRYGQLTKAFKSLNAEKVKAWLTANTTSDFFYRTASGRTFNAAGMVRMLNTEFQATRSVKAAQTDLSNFDLTPDEVHCTVTSHYVFVLAHDKKLENDSIAINDWVKTSKGWRLKSIVETASSH
jgi:hypothetical protein